MREEDLDTGNRESGAGGAEAPGDLAAREEDWYARSVREAAARFLERLRARGISFTEQTEADGTRTITVPLRPISSDIMGPKDHYWRATFTDQAGEGVGTSWGDISNLGKTHSKKTCRAPRRSLLRFCP